VSLSKINWGVQLQNHRYPLQRLWLSKGKSPEKKGPSKVVAKRDYEKPTAIVKTVNQKNKRGKRTNQKKTNTN